jgi:transposase
MATIATPKSSEGVVEMIQILKAARDKAVKAQTQVMVALRAMIVTADAALRVVSQKC